jgi:hypothetical protein
MTAPRDGALQQAIDAGEYDRAALRLAAGVLAALPQAPAAREQLLALLSAPSTASRRSSSRTGTR